MVNAIEERKKIKEFLAEAREVSKCINWISKEFGEPVNSKTFYNSFASPSTRKRKLIIISALQYLQTHYPTEFQTAQASSN